jgi:hypothetical protein
MRNAGTTTRARGGRAITAAALMIVIMAAPASTISGPHAPVA